MSNKNGGRYRLLTKAKDGSDPRAGRNLRREVCGLVACSPVRGAALVAYSTRWWTNGVTPDAQYLICLVYRGYCSGAGVCH